jgi:hypothetical protein
LLFNLEALATQFQRQRVLVHLLQKPVAQLRLHFLEERVEDFVGHVRVFEDITHCESPVRSGSIIQCSNEVY